MLGQQAVNMLDGLHQPILETPLAERDAHARDHALPLGGVEVDGDGLGVNARGQGGAEAPLRAAERRRGQARQQPGRIAVEVRHARRTVVQHPSWLAAWPATDGLEHRQAGVGAGEGVDVGAVVHDIDAQPERPVTLVDVCTPDQMLPTAKRRPLIDAVVEGDVTLVVLDATAQREPRLLRQVARVHERGVRVRSLLDFYEEWLGKLPVSELERQSLMFDIAEIHGTGYASARRLLRAACAVGADDPSRDEPEPATPS